MPLADFVDTTDLSDFRAGDPATLVGQAQSRIRSYCEWHVAPKITETILVDGRGSPSLQLPSLHVVDVTSITNEGELVDPDDYDWSADGYVVLNNGGWWSRRPRQVEVVFQHGYEDVPADLVGVAVALASRLATSPSGVKREAAGAVSLEYGSSDFFADEREILDRYKLPPRP